jgi:hypothetical protein
MAFLLELIKNTVNTASAKVIPTLNEGLITDIKDTGPIQNIVVWFLGVFWIVAVGMVIWAAFLFLTAGGDEEKVKEAKKRLTYALIAAAVALLSTGIDVIAYGILTQ